MGHDFATRCYIDCDDDPSTTVVAHSSQVHSAKLSAWRVVAGFGSASGGSCGAQPW
ncbi:hypothetical protein PPSIR1_01527 [Plesiocystis pacifica SIR-1]|uniref:Uncharacterized protein n=1 Tax=Plesiocystis pacifica SIR-1 TaxID=391625 RepID=A6G8F6_9BACT|nr:hypothetical protein PPSIR1_01527 [Plesiocystis pacifica SIR-1]